MTLPSFTGLITGEMTLNVPTDFTDIQAALDYLNDKKIAPNVAVTIQVADGTYNFTETIEIKHPDGNRINIIGNVTNPDNCVISFMNSDCGFLINRSNKLGSLQGFKLVGNNVVKFGIMVDLDSFVACSNLVVEKFAVVGIFVLRGSTVELKSIKLQNNNYGLQLNQQCYAWLESCEASNNNYGFASLRGSYILAEAVTSTYNQIGVQVYCNSAFDIHKASDISKNTGKDFSTGLTTAIDGNIYNLVLG